MHSCLAAGSNFALSRVHYTAMLYTAWAHRKARAWGEFHMHPGLLYNTWAHGKAGTLIACTAARSRFALSN